MPYTFEHHLRHIRFEILPDHKFSDGQEHYNEASKQWMETRDQLRISLKTSVQCSMVEGIQIAKLASEMQLTPEGCIEKLNRLESEGKIRFREYISPLDQHRFEVDAGRAS